LIEILPSSSGTPDAAWTRPDKVLYGKPEVLEQMPPWQGGGNMITDVTFERTVYQEPPAKFEAGTGSIADAVGLDGYRPEEVGSALDKHGIAVRAGHHCAQPILRRYGLESAVRPSLAMYNTVAEVDLLVAAVRRLAADAGRRR
jgi:cysteine desulfurase / selenocysteine lyase